MNDMPYQQSGMPQPVGMPQPMGMPQQFQPIEPPKKRHTALKAGFWCLIFGILLGGGGIFAYMYFLNPVKCQDCKCPENPTPAVAADINNEFLKLEEPNQNIIYSPLSIRYGLSLLNAGAAGSTKAEINNVLGNEELPKYQNITNKLSLANGVFVRDTFTSKVLPEYFDTASQKFQAEIAYDSFADSSKLDTWVKDKTFGLIEKAGVRDEKNTQMVLINALAIKMDWETPFKPEKTFGKSFYKNDNTEIEATTMHQETTNENVGYLIDDEATILKMPLESTDSSALEFVAVMPSGNLTNYISHLKTSELNAKIEQTIPANKSKKGVEIFIPKFKFSYDLNFTEDLNKLGIVKAFDPDEADFSNMAQASEKLFVSDAIHSANIDFSEDGIKAAAVTAFAMMSGTAIGDNDEPVVVRIDHPFFFVIRDRKDGTIWFSGAVYEPNLWANDSTSYKAL